MHLGIETQQLQSGRFLFPVSSYFSIYDISVRVSAHHVGASSVRDPFAFRVVMSGLDLANTTGNVMTVFSRRKLCPVFELKKIDLKGPRVGLRTTPSEGHTAANVRQSLLILGRHTYP